MSENKESEEIMKKLFNKLLLSFIFINKFEIFKKNEMNRWRFKKTRIIELNTDCQNIIYSFLYNKKNIFYKKERKIFYGIYHINSEIYYKSPSEYQWISI